MKIYVICLVLLVAGMLPFSALAGPVLRTGDTVTVDASQEVKGDFYGFGSSVTISGIVENDAYLGGSAVTMNAEVKEDLTILGGVVQVHGAVGDDLRITGGEITIAGPVKGDLVLMGGSVHILSTAEIAGDILFMGGKFTIEGPVHGSLHGSADSIRINAPIDGDISVEVVDLITLGSAAQVKGDVTYTSASELSRAQEAVIDGDVRRTHEESKATSTSPTKSLFFVGMLAFMSALLFSMGGRKVEHILTLAESRFGFNGLIGLGTFLVLPFVSLVLFVSLLGVLTGGFLLSVFFVFLFTALAFVPLWLGSLCTRIIFKRDQFDIWTVLLGILCLAVMSTLPFGGFALFVIMLVLMGSITISIYRSLRVS